MSPPPDDCEPVEQGSVPDGRLINISVTTSPIKNDHGSIIGASKIAERSFASEQCLNAFFTSASAGLALLDERLRYVRINETVAKINGVSIEEHLGKTIREIIPKLAPMVEPLLQKVLATGEPMLNIEISGETSGRPGVMRHWLESFFPIFGMNASPEGVGVIFVEITERKRAEETLQRLRDQSDAILNSVSEGVHGIGLDGRIIFENPSSAAMLGYEIAELIGQPAHSTMHHTRSNGTAYPQSECPIYTALKDGVVQHVIDEVFWRKDGTSFPVEYKSTPLRDKDGAIMGTTVVFSDITERKRSQEELRQSEHRFREMLQNLNLIAIMVDTQCHLTFCNNYLLRLTGWKHEDVIGCDWIEKFIPRSDATTREMFFSNIHTGKVPVHYENAIKTKNGEERLIAWNNTVLRDAEGNVSGVAAVGEDVTESRRAAERIAEQAALLDKTQDAIVVCNLDGHILFWSKGAERLYGFTGEEALGQKSRKLIYDDDTRKYDEAFTATLAGGEWTGELQQSTKDGRKLTVESRWTLVRDAQGNRKSILAINTDVTERKKIEAQFLRAQRMESIGTLAGGVAHDLNNILAPIMMAIEILRDVTDDPQKKHILETIEASAQRGSDIVRQILSFARGVEGKRIEVQPKHLLKEMEHIVRNTFPKNIRLEATFPPEPWTIIGDPTQVHQILLNLCVNARDAMPEGGTLVIGVENCMIDAHYAAMNPDAKVGDYVCLSVADTGTGMPPSVIDKIFDPFFTTKEMGLGTGLGLSTVLAIVKSHGGFLKVDSEPDKGTTFRIYLPAAPTGGESADEAKQAVLPHGHGETVLIVDDEESILTITSQTLQAFGYEVLRANNGAEAVAIYAQHRDKIAVVLTDMMMPVMDGRATIHALRQINPTVKIIAASGLNAKADVSTASDAGVKTFLSKPYSAETLLKALRTVLDDA